MKRLRKPKLIEPKIDQWWADCDKRTIRNGYYTRVGQIIEMPYWDLYDDSRSELVKIRWRDCDLSSVQGTFETQVNIKRLKPGSTGYTCLGDAPPPNPVPVGYFPRFVNVYGRPRSKMIDWDKPSSIGNRGTDGYGLIINRDLHGSVEKILGIDLTFYLASSQENLDLDDLCEDLASVMHKHLD